jgi:hypothetical protein
MAASLDTKSLTNPSCIHFLFHVYSMEKRPRPRPIVKTRRPLPKTTLSPVGETRASSKEPQRQPTPSRRPTPSRPPTPRGQRFSTTGTRLPPKTTPSPERETRASPTEPQRQPTPSRRPTPSRPPTPRGQRVSVVDTRASTDEQPLTTETEQPQETALKELHSTFTRGDFLLTKLKATLHLYSTINDDLLLIGTSENKDDGFNDFLDIIKTTVRELTQMIESVSTNPGSITNEQVEEYNAAYIKYKELFETFTIPHGIYSSRFSPPSNQIRDNKRSYGLHIDRYIFYDKWTSLKMKRFRMICEIMSDKLDTRFHRRYYDLSQLADRVYRCIGRIRHIQEIWKTDKKTPILASDIKDLQDEYNAIRKEYIAAFTTWEVGDLPTRYMLNPRKKYKPKRWWSMTWSKKVGGTRKKKK